MKYKNCFVVVVVIFLTVYVSEHVPPSGCFCTERSKATFYRRWFISGGPFFNHLVFYHLKTDTWPNFTGGGWNSGGWFWNLKIEDYILYLKSCLLSTVSTDAGDVIKQWACAILSSARSSLPMMSNRFPTLRFIDGAYRKNARKTNEEGL